MMRNLYLLLDIKLRIESADKYLTMATFIFLERQKISTLKKGKKKYHKHIGRNYTYAYFDMGFYTPTLLGGKQKQLYFDMRSKIP